MGGYSLDNAIPPSMRSMASPWPSLVKRLRFMSSLKQADLAELLGVDPTTVSRWERNLCIPDTSVQKRVRDMLRRFEPAISRSFIEESPGLVAIGRMDAIGVIAAASRAAAAAYLLTSKEMRDLAVYDIASESILSFIDGLNSNSAWRHGEISMWQVIMKRRDGNWARFNFTPIGNTGFCMSIAVVVPRPHGFEDKDFQLTFQSFDELCD